MTAKPIILWRRPDGTFTQEAPSQLIASTISEVALKRLAAKRAVFILELNEEGDAITATKIEA
jgi:hypothetical protein